MKDQIVEVENTRLETDLGIEVVDGEYRESKITTSVRLHKQ